MLAYKIGCQRTQQWQPRQPLPEELFDEANTIYSFNYAFEWQIWNYVCCRYWFPRLDVKRCVDVQALCGRYGLPQNLGDASKILNGQQKFSTGKKLIQLFCAPPYGRDSKMHLLPEYESQWRDFMTYNIGDVEATYDVLNQLPSDKLSDSEYDIWLLNHKINVRGIPIAVDEARQILEVTKVFLDEHNQRLPQLTNGKVTKVTQVKRIKDWLATVGYDVEDLTADSVSKMLERDDLPDEVTEVLELRAGMGLSSLGKYQRIKDMNYAGRLYFNSRYYGTHTGRITGAGFQLLNLPRAQAENPEAEIAKFMDTSIVYDNPVLSARALVRSMVKAGPGNVIMAADYGSIEYVLQAWAVGDFSALARFKNGFSPYKDLAMLMYKVDYDDVTKDQRQMGKVGVLGCGYGLGAQGFIRYADQFGVGVTIERAKQVVYTFRQLYNKMETWWYSLARHAELAVNNPGQKAVVTTPTSTTSFEVVRDRVKSPWLKMMLPSGRAMYYRNPRMEMGKYGPCVACDARNQKTAQWQTKIMTPGKWAENVIQAIGRDLLYHGKMLLDDAGFDIIGSVYDEVICEAREEDADLDRMIRLMCTNPSWCKEAPIIADGYISKRYKK